MSRFDAAGNLVMKAARRLGAAHKPFTRLMRRRARRHEHLEFSREAARTEAAVARIARADGPIIVGPWLAEVGYEVLYWIPFLRWFQDAYGLAPDRLIAVSRGGLEESYREIASTYVDLFDLVTPTELGARNAERRAEREGGGQKQSGVSAFDEELIRAVRARAGAGAATVLHPSEMFRLFRHVWHGNLPFDLLWTHVRHAAPSAPGPRLAGLPDDYVAVKFYGGPALAMTGSSRAAVRSLVAHAATLAPVVVLDTDLPVDEHRDFDLRGIPGVSFLGARLTPRDNLGLQIAAIGRARFFLGTCGGLAWLAPFLGVPTVAVFDDDRLLTSHLLVARQAGVRVGAADFAPLDLRALARTGLLDARPAAPRIE